MKRIARLFIAAFAFVGLTVAGLFLYDYLLGRSTFATYAELEASGLIERGWLPDYLPRSIRDISESHSLDTNSSYATFKYSPSDIGSIEQNCKVLVRNEEGSKYICPPFEGRSIILVLKADGTAILETDENEI